MWVNEKRLIDSPLGQVALTFSSATSVRCVLKRFDYEGARFKEFSAHFHYRAATGRWQASDYMLQEEGGYVHTPFERVPRKDVGAIVRDTLQGWWLGNGVEIQRAALDHELRDAERHAAHLKSALAEQQRKIKQAKAALKALPAPEIPSKASDSALEALVGAVL
jgi:hypothetical protein